MKNNEWKEEFGVRLKNFGISIILLSNNLPRTPAGFAITPQLIRSSLSIGANFIEAQNASSKKDFVQKLSISLREATETVYWLEVILESSLIKTEEAKVQLNEAKSITAMLVSSVKKAKSSLQLKK